jgi:hypothetical protein
MQFEHHDAPTVARTRVAIRVSTASRSPARPAEEKRVNARSLRAINAHVVHKSISFGESKAFIR